MIVMTTINSKRVPIEASATSILNAAQRIEEEVIAKTQNIIVFAADAYNWCNGYTSPSIGIRLATKEGGPEGLIDVEDIAYMIAGTLRRIDNNKEIVRLNDLMAIGFQNAFVDLRAQACIGGMLSRPNLGKRKITAIKMIGDMAYLVLAPM